MPTYQYACTECDHRFEAVQSFSDSALTECPECKGKLRKLYGAVGVVFKGSGFYRTDNRSSSSSESKSSESKSSSTSTKSETSSTAKKSDTSSAPAAAAS
ncbi:FmdB family zinc ribbon protein [Saccharothrix australiensis]|uniref:Putative FmdB family regulatory protein n=1 Tax=Saccharothrix australiensis TaxID=2072 RepID=A0A495VSY7_9PSEU|nr:FmdB family zinc ribbon protein [Saccharothrix australiensis]RKT52459.1 putative FmdB family regulatory protein [Saccharothrix australiensis]